MNIIERIDSSPEEITEEDLKDWVLYEVVDYYEPKFNSLSKFAYSLDSGDDLARRAFRESSVKTLKKGLEAFLFKSQHYKSGRSLNPYLTTCLNRLADSIRREVTSQKKKSHPVCPACKSLSNKEFLRYESKMLRCYTCTNEQDNLKDKISEEESKEKPDRAKIVEFNSEIALRKIFSLHSRKGYRCPDCAMFIPASFASGQRVSCPYDSVCAWFGHIDELEPMSHPVGLSNHSYNHVSLNETIGPKNSDSGASTERQDFIESDSANPDVQIEVRQKFEKEINTVSKVIDIQSSRVDREPEHKSIKRKLMYEAFKNILSKYPDDMVSYLAHKNHGGLPIQSRIFQEFIRLVENSLPFNLYYKGDVVEIYSIQDPRLDLFTGYSEFETHIRPDGTIPNCTKEVYIGGRKGIDHGPCFIGQLVDVEAIDADNQSLLNCVEFYTFTQIKMNEEVPPGVSVRVKHFRMPSHYEMHGLVYLQRIRRKIVDSVHQRLNGERRKVGK